MKMRLRGSTLRLRLTRGEVDEIGAGDTIREETLFPGGQTLCYELAVGQSYGATLTTASDVTVVRIHVPQAQARAWAQSDEVGFAGEDPLAIDALEVLIEKDFTCITPRQGEEELDTFPNPNAMSA